MLIAPSDIRDDSVLVPGAAIGVVDVDDRAVLVDESAGRGWALNPTGTLVWKVLDGETPLGELVDDLSVAFDAPRREVADSVRNLVQSFGLLGLLQNVARRVDSIPIDVEFVAPTPLDDCGEPGEIDDGAPLPSFDSRYLAAPPNA